MRRLSHIARGKTCLFVLVLLDDYGSVVTAETERIRQRGTHGTLLCAVESEVKAVIDIFVLIFRIVIDCRGNDVFLHSLDTEHSFKCTCGADDRSWIWSRRY